MSRLVFADVDRSRYDDLPAEVEYVPGQFGFRAVDRMERTTGYSLERVIAGMNGILAHREDGTEYVKLDRVAVVAFSWMVLWDAGHHIDWDGFDLRGYPSFISDEPEPEGKAPDPDGSNSTTTTQD